MYLRLYGGESRQRIQLANRHSRMLVLSRGATLFQFTATAVKKGALNRAERLFIVRTWLCMEGRSEKKDMWALQALSVVWQMWY